MARKKTEGTSKTKIYDALRREIITGHRRPGERLAVEALAERFSTSVTPVTSKIVLPTVRIQPAISSNRRTGSRVPAGREPYASLTAHNIARPTISGPR